LKGDMVDFLYGLAILSWPLIYLPMHNALIKDSLRSLQPKYRLDYLQKCKHGHFG